MFGFAADLAGAFILFGIMILGDYLVLPNELIGAINYDPFSHPVALLLIMVAILVSGICLFLLNYKVIFRTLIAEKGLRFKVALTIALVTMPWTFLLPTKWFYRGF